MKSCHWRQYGWTLRILCFVAQFCLTLCEAMDYSLPGYPINGDSPGKNTGVGCHVFLQGISMLSEISQTKKINTI